jgi:hypothetical protein
MRGEGSLPSSFDRPRPLRGRMTLLAGECIRICGESSLPLREHERLKHLDASLDVCV